MRFILLALAFAGSAIRPQEKATDWPAEFRALVKGRHDAFEAVGPTGRGMALSENEASQAFIPKFLDLARRSKGTDTSLRALSQAISAWQWGVENGITKADSDVGRAGRAAADLLRSTWADHVAAPIMEEFSSNLINQHPLLKDDPVWNSRECEAIFRTIAAKNPSPAVKGAALGYLGRWLAKDPTQPERRREAIQLLEQVKKEFDGTPAAERAAKLIPLVHEGLKHSRVGRRAEDFDAVDLQDKAFKLSEFRGKVVLLEFWGFW